jgi:hypothetical protein
LARAAALFWHGFGLIGARQHNEGLAMSKDIIRFPVKTTQRIKNGRGKFSVSCAVSMRWLRFQESTGYVENNSEAVVVDVMTDSDFDGSPSKKLCELVLELDDLRAILKQYEAKT